MSEKNVTERDSLLNEAEDMYIGEEAGGAIVRPISSLLACGPILSRGVICNPITITIKK